MPVVLDEYSPLYKELKRWDTPRRDGGMKCDGFEEFPKMLYRARKTDQGAILVGDPVGEASPDLNRAAAAMAFTKSCQLIVRSSDDQARAEADGWRAAATDAIAYLERFDEAISTAAAEEQWRLQHRMSEKARTEFAAADRATSEHLPTLPAPKRRPRGRPKKAGPTPEAA